MLPKLLLLIALLFFCSCEKSEDGPKLEGCDAFVIEQLGYVPSDGNFDFSGTNCIQYLNKFQDANGTPYYSPNCNCCDLIPTLYNCAGENVCENDSICTRSVGTEFIRIVGVKE